MPSAPLTMSDPAPSERATWTSPSENCTQSASRVMDAGDAEDAEELTSRTDESVEFLGAAVSRPSWRTSRTKPKCWLLVNNTFCDIAHHGVPDRPLLGGDYDPATFGTPCEEIILSPTKTKCLQRSYGRVLVII